MSRDDVSRDEACTMYNTVFKKLMDIGDIVGVKGFVFRTNMGEISVHAKELVMLSKSLRPLPIVKEKDGKVFDAFTDPELRYRQRYLDLIVNPQVKDVFIKRTKMINAIRQFYTEMGVWRWRLRCCRLYREELRPVRLSRIITHWIYRSICVSRMSCT